MYLTKQDQIEVDKFVESVGGAGGASTQVPPSQPLPPPPQSTPIPPRSPHPDQPQQTRRLVHDESLPVLHDETTNVFDATEYYNLDELKSSKPNPLALNLPGDDVGAVDLATTQPQLDKSTSRSRGFEFVSGLFRKSSPSRSRSPGATATAQPQPASTAMPGVSKSTSPIRSLSPIKTIRADENPTTTPRMESFPAPILGDQMTSSASSNVQDVIRAELKRIMQIQHEAIMGLLGGGSIPAATTNSQCNLLFYSLFKGYRDNYKLII